MAVLSFTSCEDVPAPYNTPTINKADDGQADAEAKGTGTKDDPYNVAGVIAYCKSLGSSVESTNDVYIKGTVTQVKEQYSATYGNGTFYIADNASGTEFYVYRAYYFDNKKWTTGDKELKVGDEVVFCGKVVNYYGTTPETVQNKAYLYSLNGETSGSGDETTTGEAKGTGTAADPFNVAGVVKYIADGGSADTEVYTKGIVVSVKSGSYDASYGSLKYYISEDGTSTNQFYVYNGYAGPNKTKFTGEDALKQGDVVVICGKVKEYSGTKEYDTGNYIVSLNGKSTTESGETTPDTPTTGEEMTYDNISVNDLPTNAYGSQSTTDESTWYTWTHNNITYKGAKICVSNGSQGKGIQMQGNASDATKQGFLFNSTAFDKEIKTITLYLSTTATSKYAPSYSLYAAKTANGRDTQVTGASTNETSGDWKTYTEVYDMSSYNTKFFTLFNNTTGALYIEKIVVTLK